MTSILDWALGSSQIVTDSSVTHLAEANPDFFTDALIQSILSGSSISSALTTINTNGFNSQVSAALSIIDNETDSDYRWLLPSNTQGASRKFEDSLIADIVTKDLNLPYGCIVEFNFIAPMTPFISILPYLLDVRGYNIATREITKRPGTWQLPFLYNGYLVGGAVTVTNATLESDGVTVTIEYTANMVYLDAAIGVITPIPDTDYNKVFTEQYTLDTKFRKGLRYCVVGYRTLDSLGAANTIRDWWFNCVETSWWYFPIGSQNSYNLGIDPQYANQNNAYPIIPLRYNFKAIDADNLPKLYEIGNRITNVMGMDFDSLSTTIASNPDLDKIFSANIMLAADLQTSNQIVLNYLVDFFTYLNKYDDITVFDALDGTSSDYNIYTNYIGAITEGIDRTSFGESVGSDVSNKNINNPIESYLLGDYGKLRMYIEYSTITSILVTGSIGDVGYSSLEISTDIDNTIILRKQIAINMYRQVTVIGLTHTNSIIITKDIEGVPTEIEYTNTTTPEMVRDDPDNHKFVIPLQRTVADNFNVPKRNQLYKECIILYITAYDKQYSSWYTNEMFQDTLEKYKNIFMLGSIVGWLSGLGPTIQAGVNALMWYFIETFSLTIVFSLGVKFLSPIIAKYLDPDIAALISVVAAIAVARVGGQTIAIGALEIPTASMLMFASSVARSASEIAMANKINAVNAEYEDWVIDADAKMAILEAKKEELEPNYLLPIGYLLTTEYNKPDTVSTPDALYDKVHLGNVGVFTLDMIDTYVDRALTLPQSNML